MATVTVTRGFGHWIQGMTSYNNRPGSSGSGDWTWNIGQASPSWASYQQHCAGCVEYTLPAISENVHAARKLAVPMNASWSMGSCQILAVLSTTAPVDLEYRYGPTEGVISNEVSMCVDSGSWSQTVNFTLLQGATISNRTIYLYLYGNRSYDNSSSGNAVITQSFGDAVLTYEEGSMRPYTPYIGDGTSWIAVTGIIGLGD